MSWDQLDGLGADLSAKSESARATAAALAKNYAACFESEAGEKVLEHLVNNFVIRNTTPLNAANVLYEAGYHNGEAGLVRMILSQIERAKTL